MNEAIDPAPFEPFMPPSVRALIAEARAGRGPAADWLTGVIRNQDTNEPRFGFQSALTNEFLLGQTRLPDEQVGWLVGIGMFGDENQLLSRTMKSHYRTTPAAVILEAFAAGLRAGVTPTRRQWNSIEVVAGLTETLPTALADALPLGLVSDSAATRGVALRLAQRLGASARELIEAARATADKKAQKHLDRALAALAPATTKETTATGDDVLARILVAYGETFDRALEPAIKQLGREAAQRRGPLTAKSKGELEGAWLALAAQKDPGDVDRLLGTPWPGAWKTALARVEALRALPPDPRIAALLPAIETHYASKGSRPFHDAARRVASHHRGSNKGTASPALLAEARAALCQPIDLEAAWRALRQDPSDERRAVLADALQTVGDPRGEYIALSLAIADGHAEASVQQRAAQLLNANIDAWTGPLPGAIRDSRQFARGFLTSVRLKTRAQALLDSVDAPEWWSVETLHLEAADRVFTDHVPALEKLLAVAPSLRTLIGNASGVEELTAKLKGPFPRLRSFGASNWLPRTIAAFPSLTLAGTAAHHWDGNDVWRAASEHGFAALLLFGVEDLRAAIEALEASQLREARLVLDRVYRVAEWHEGWCVRVFRGEPRAELVWGLGRYEAGALTTQLEILSAVNKRDIVVTLPRIGAADAAREAADFKDANVRTDGNTRDLWKP